MFDVFDDVIAVVFVSEELCESHLIVTQGCISLTKINKTQSQDKVLTGLPLKIVLKVTSPRLNEHNVRHWALRK